MSPIPSHAPAFGGGATEGGGENASGEAGGLHWTVPDGWVEVPPSSPMRRAQYRIPAAGGDAEDGECVVYYFGAGQGGDVQGNMARWVSQFAGHGGGTEAPQFDEIKVGGLTVNRVEVGGTYTPSPMSMTGDQPPAPKPGYRLIGAIAPGPDANWFFKCTGPAKTMQANRERFDALVKSIQVAR